LLDSVNAVLPSVKEPDMFVTFAALRFDTSDVAEFTLAGDVFALVTDGLIETLNHQEGEFDSASSNCFFKTPRVRCRKSSMP
jgi:hypothetical protein